MRVVFVNPYYARDFSKSSRWAARSRGRVQRHPEQLAMAAGQVASDGHEVRVFDAQAKNYRHNNTLIYLSGTFNPDLAVIWCTTPSIYSDKEFAERAKQVWKCPVVLVGPHVTALPQDTLKDTKLIDGIAVGEFDETIRDLANGVSMEKCRGIARKEDGDVVLNKPRKLVDVNKLSMPSWLGVNINDYHDAGKKYPFITIIGDRSCYNACSFCSERFTIHKGSWRQMSINRFLNEIEYDLYIFPKIKEIMVENDTLVGKKTEDYLYNLCDEMEGRRFKFTWSANARADFDNIDLLKRLKNNGLRWLCVGYESGNQDILNSVGKNVTLQQMRDFTNAAKKAGVKVNGCFMIGLPGETKETAQKTIDFAMELNPHSLQISGAVPYPGTPFYEWVKKNGYLVPKDWPEWVDEHFEQQTLVSYPNLPKEQINAFINQGLKRFYGRKQKQLEILSSVRSFGDVQRLWHGYRSYKESTQA